MSKPARKDGSLSREHFMLREFRLVADLKHQGVLDADIVAAATDDNLFQYPTTSEAARVARTMLMRLEALQDDALVAHAATALKEQAAQINLYAMMRSYALVEQFMIQEIGQRISTLDYHISRADILSFLARYQTTNPDAATFAEATVKRSAGVLMECLCEVGYLANTRSEDLIPLIIEPTLEDVIKKNNDHQMLSAFSCLEVL